MYIPPSSMEELGDSCKKYCGKRALEDKCKHCRIVHELLLEMGVVSTSCLKYYYPWEKVTSDKDETNR